MTIVLQRRVAEASTDALYLTFYDVDESVVDPASVVSARYKVNDKTSGRELRAWTSVTVDANPFLLPLAVQDTAAVDTRRAVEERVVSFELNYSGEAGTSLLAEQISFYVEHHAFRP